MGARNLGDGGTLCVHTRFRHREIQSKFFRATANWRSTVHERGGRQKCGVLSDGLPTSPGVNGIKRGWYSQVPVSKPHSLSMFDDAWFVLTDYVIWCKRRLALLVFGSATCCMVPFVSGCLRCSLKNGEC